MARVPYDPSGGEINPTGSLGGPEQIQASPSMFGAEVGTALEKSGAQGQQDAQQTAQTILAHQELTNELYANDANTQGMKQVAQKYGEFQRLEGKSAYDALPQFQQDVEDVYQKSIATAPNDQAKAMLSKTMRYVSDAYTRYGQSYADQQWKSWQDKSSIDGATEFGNQAALAMNQPQLRDTFVASGADQIRKLYEQRGYPIEAQNAQVAKYVGTTVKNIVLQMAKGGDIDGASRLTDQYAPQMDKGSVLEIKTSLRPLLVDATAAREVPRYKAIAGGAPSLDGGPVPAGAVPIKAAILGQESGDRDDAPTSANGAVGPGQVMPGTFVQYAKPGEDIHNPADNRAVSGRIIDDLAAKYGNDPARIAVGYFSGPGNIAPADSPTPWVSDKADANGKTVSSYVSDVLSRTSKMGQAAALQQVNIDYANDPVMARRLTADLHREFAADNLAATGETLAQRKAKETATNGYVTEMMKGNTGPDVIKRISDDPALDAATKEKLWSVAESHSKSDLARDTKTYGTGFYGLFQQIHLPDGDPQKLSDPTQLLSHVGDSGDLTLSGYDRLNQEMAGKRSADGEAESAMKRQFLANAKSQISGADPLLHIRDPKGEELYLKFMASFFPAYDKAKADGKNSSALLNPDSPDYLGKGISGFKRPLAEFTADLLRGDATAEDAGAAKADGSAPDTTTAAGLLAAVRAGRLTRAEGEKIALDRGWIQGAPPPPANADISPPIR